MGKKVNDIVLDAALGYIESYADKMIACSAEPADYNAAVNTVDLADVAMTGDDFAISDNTGTGYGRKLTVTEKPNITINHTGSATHIALVDVSAYALLYVTTCNELYLTQGQTMTFGSWTITLKDPT